MSITVEGKVAGQKRALFTDWRIELPADNERQGDRLKLRDLITSIVIEDVNAFRLRQEDRRLARVMSRQEIEQDLLRGKVNPGEQDIHHEVNIDVAIAVALQAFEDGLYFVFIDEIQQTQLNDEVFLKTNSKVIFLRLTALVGG